MGLSGSRVGLIDLNILASRLAALKYLVVFGRETFFGSLHWR